MDRLGKNKERQRFFNPGKSLPFFCCLNADATHLPREKRKSRPGDSAGFPPSIAPVLPAQERNVQHPSIRAASLPSPLRRPAAQKAAR